MNLSICILTYKRPDSLQRLLSALKELDFQRVARPQIQLIVVDNDAAASAQSVCQMFSHPTITMTYTQELQQGIPIARNRALDAVSEESDFVCFIDDDEWPTPFWMDELLATQQTTQSTCVMGPVIPDYPPETPPWIREGRFFDRRGYPDGTRIGYAASCNVLIRRDFLTKNALRFDESLRFNGGSDTLFFKRAIALGMTVVWAAQAIAWEEVPSSRLSLKWLLRRQYRFGNTLALCDRLFAPHRITRPLRLIKGGGRCVLGVCYLPIAALRGRAEAARTLLFIAKGIGMLTGVIGVNFEEYTPDKVASDRGFKTGKQ